MVRYTLLGPDDFLLPITNHSLDEDNSLSEVIADVSVLEEVLRMILEIINSCLVNQIKNNSNLIYTLLYKKELFQPFVTHPTFQVT